MRLNPADARRELHSATAWKGETDASTKVKKADASGLAMLVIDAEAISGGMRVELRHHSLLVHTTPISHLPPMKKSRVFGLGILILGLAFLSTVSASKDEDAAGEVIELTPDSFEKMVLHGAQDEVFFVKFYAPWCGHCKKLEPIFELAAQKTAHMIKLARLDADKNRDIAERYGIKGFPTLKIFKGGKLVQDYEGARTAQAIADAGLALLPNRVNSLRPTPQDVTSWLNSDNKLPHVVVVKEKPETSPLLKSLAIRYKGRATFAEIKTPGRDIQTSLGLTPDTQLPAFLMFRPGSGEAIQHQGQMNFASLDAFLAANCPDTPPETNSGRKSTQKTATQAASPLVEVVRASSAASFAKSQLAVIGFFKEIPGPADLEALQITAGKFKRDSQFSFWWGLESDFSERPMKEDSLLVFNVKRDKVATLPKGKKLSSESLGALLEDVIAGNVKFVPGKFEKKSE